MPSRTMLQGGEYSTAAKTNYFEALQNWIKRKRKRTTPYPPSPSLSPSSSNAMELPSTSTSKFGHSSKKHRGNGHQTIACAECCSNFSRLPSPALEDASVTRKQLEPQNTPIEPFDGVSELEPSTPKTLARARRRGSSVRLRELLPPKDFSSKDLNRPSKLSQPPCRMSIGCVSQILPEPGWRVATKPRSREFCFTSPFPLYSAKHHSSLRTGNPFTVYFEGEILCGNGEDTVCVSMGLVAGKDRVSRMPGFERGSIGVQCRNGQLYLGNALLKQAETRPFEAGDRLGFGLTYSLRESSTTKESQTGFVLAPAVDVALFVSRDGILEGTWNLREVAEEPKSLCGFEGDHDIYAAVGTSREVKADILFDREDWLFSPLQNTHRG